MYDKTKRADMSAEARLKFTDQATKCILRNHKLKLWSLKGNDEEKLNQVHSLHFQISELKAHIEKFEMDDVFNMAYPVDVSNIPELHPVPSRDLFRDYMLVNPSEVAASNVWFQSWVAAEYVHENLSMSLDFLKSNAEESLWHQCFETYESITAVNAFASGGPLMFILMLQRIQDTSEAAIEHLHERVQSLKISKVEGENVDKVVSLIRSTYYLLRDASTPTRNHVPDNFPKLVLQVLQTSSVPTFNEHFHLAEMKAQGDAFRGNGIPQYPTVEQSLDLASNLYMSMKDDWFGGESPSVFNANDKNDKSPHSNPNVVCWNCGKKGHAVPKCKRPKDSKRIAENKRKYMEERDQHTPGGVQPQPVSGDASPVTPAAQVDPPDEKTAKRTHVAAILREYQPQANTAASAPQAPPEPEPTPSSPEVFNPFDIGAIMDRLDPYI